MSKVLGFSIEIQGTKVAIDTTKEIRAALTKLNEEMSNVSSKDVYDKMNKDAAKLKAELKAVTDQQRNYVREIEAGKTGTGSYQQLNAELVKLRQNYKKLSEEERSSKVGQETIKNIQNLDKKLKDIDKSMGQFQRNVGNYPGTIIGALQNVSPTLGNVANNIREIGAAAGSVGKILASAFAVGGIIALSAPLVQAASRAEQAKINFNALSQSVVKGTELYQDLVNVSKQTPFELENLQQAAKSLLAYGFSTKEVVVQVQRLGDIAAGVGTEKLPNLILALGQVKAAGQLTGNELRQFTETGVDLLGQLAKDGGKSIAQVKKDISDGKVKFEEVNEALKKLTSEGGQFFGLMEQQSKSLAGQWSNLKDSLSVLAADLGSLLLPALKSITDQVNYSITAWKELFGISKITGGGQVEQIQALKNVYEGYIKILSDPNSQKYQINETLSKLKQQYPEFIKGIDIATRSQTALNAAVAKGNDLFGLKLKTAQKSAELAQLQANIEKTRGDLSPETLQRKFDQIAKLNSEISALNSDYENKSGGTGKTLIGSKETDKKAAEDLEKYYQDRLTKLVEEATTLRLGLVKDKYEKERQEAKKQYDDRIKSAALSETELNKLTANKRAQLKTQQTAVELLAINEYEKKIADIDKQFVEDSAKLQKETDTKSLAELKQYYDLQKSYVMTGEENTYDEKKTAIEKIIKLEEAYLENMVLLGNEAEQTATNNRIKGLKKTLTGLTNGELKSDYDFYQNLSKQIKDADEAALDAKRDKAIQVMNLVGNAASEVGNFLDNLNQQQLAAMDEQIAKQTDNLSLLQEKMSNTTGAARVELSRQIENEKAALAKSNEQKKEAEKQAAKEHQRIALVQAIINTASAILVALSSPPFATFKAISAGIIGGLQTATIAAQAFAQGGKVLSGERVTSNSGLNIRRSNGDNVLATVRTNEVVLNERQQAMLGGARTFQKIGVPGFATGGYTGDPLPQPSQSFIDGITGAGTATNNEIRELIRAMDSRIDRMQVHVVGEDVANELNSQSKAKKAAVI